jgi:hypothetical protein
MKPSVALRIVAAKRRVVSARPAVLLFGLLARLHLMHAYTVWPNAAAPILIAGAADSAAVRWMNRTFRLRSRRRLALDAASWNVLRAGALVIGGDPPHVGAAMERALGRRIRDQRVAFYSTGGPRPKLHCFVFEGREPAPLAVMKVMAVAGEGGHLERETANLELVRERLRGAGRVLEALPVEPLWSGRVAGDFVVVERVDPLAIATQQAEREASMWWLRGFAEGTATGERPWSEADRSALESAVSDAWKRIGSVRADALVDRIHELGAALGGTPVPRCAVHGDFWRGNIAASGDAMRVYDWEWLSFDGQPFFDVWTYELGELRRAADRGVEDFATPLAEALQRVEAELEHRGLDPRFGVLTLPLTLARVTFRMRTETGTVTGREKASSRVMRATEELVLGPRA